jgi:hypothetical protein
MTTVIYSAAMIKRALRAWQCSPFRLSLFSALQDRGISLSQIKGTAGYQAGYTTRALPELQAEADLMWLIQVGVLRREVDGQGITDSYRLALLGQQILAEFFHEGCLEAADQGKAGLSDHLANQLARWRWWW